MDTMISPQGSPGAGTEPAHALAGVELEGAVRLLGRLAVLYGAAAGALAGVPGLARATGAVWELRVSGLVGMTLGAVLLAFAGVLATLVVAAARADLAAGVAARDGRWWRRRAAPAVRLARAARRPQGVVVPLGCVAAGAALWAGAPDPGAMVLPAATMLGAGAVALAFPFLVAQRIVAAVPPRGLPEAEALGALLRLPVLALVVGGVAEIGAGQGFGWARWGAVAAACGLGLVAVELGARGLANWFLPPPAPGAARASVSSLAAALLQSGSSGGGLAAPIKAQLGIDFSRSWALRFVRGAAMPVLLLVTLAGWGLTGVALVPLDGRAVYERLGAPVAVWQPGAHAGLPWPLGRTRAVDLGIVHATTLGMASTAAEAAPPAEGPAPESANRLWDRAHPAETSFVIAGQEASGAPSFQAVDADVTVLWRVGLDDRSALRAAYGVAAPEVLVRSELGRALALLFASRSLDDVIGADRERMADALRGTLQAALDGGDGGIEVTSVVIEAIHPPLAAARAYQDVQAAEIVANTAIAVERGRARTTASTAQQSARGAIDASTSVAAEVVSAARVKLREFTADAAAAARGGTSFRLERYFANLVAALPRSPLIILDHRLVGAGAPTLDLRAYGAPPARNADED